MTIPGMNHPSAAGRLLSGLVEICRQLVGDDTAGTALDQKLLGYREETPKLHPDRDRPVLKSTRARKSPATQQDVLKRPAAPRNIPGSSTPRPPSTTPPLPAPPQRPRIRAQEQATVTPANEDEPAAGAPTHRCSSADADALFSVMQVQLKLQQLLHPLSPLESQVQTESMRVGEALHGDSSVTAFAVTLGAAISKLGCRVVLRRITDTKQYWSKSMSNTFVVCVLPGARGKPTGLIVDPHFKEQFSTAHMTERYREIWSVLPDVFVGQVAQLMSLVQVLCHELASMFDSLGGVLPPWRAYNAYISRWISKSCADSVVSFVDTTWVATCWKSSDSSYDRAKAGVEQGGAQAADSGQKPTQRITGFDVATA